MRREILAWALIVVAVTAVVTCVQDRDWVSAEPQDGRVIVIFRGNIDLDAILRMNGKVIRKLSIIDGVSCTIPESTIRSLEEDPEVLEVRPDHEVRILEDTLPWGVERIRAEIVWGYVEGSTDVRRDGGEGVRIAVIDSGVDYDHPDLKDRFDPNLKGYDFFNDDPDPMDDNGHGTHCAGIIAASDNGIGIIGVAPKVTLYALKIMSASGSGHESDTVAAIEWCTENGVGIASMSIGSNEDLPSLHDACDIAYYRYGMLLFAAAGNDGHSDGIVDTIDYPARFESVIAVGATNASDMRAVWGSRRASSTGPELELMAPGDDVYSTYLEGGYRIMRGTSMACPHAAGAAALVWYFHPDFTNEDVRRRLRETAQDLGKQGRDDEFGYGLIDAEAAASPTPIILKKIDYGPIGRVGGVIEADRMAYIEANG